MGFLSKTTTVEVPVVDSDIGFGSFNGRNYDKTRLWILGDRTAVVCTAATDGKTILRETMQIDTGARDTKNERIVVNVVVPGSETTVPFVLDTKGCGCGFGIVSSATPTGESHYLTSIRHPDWWTQT